MYYSQRKMVLEMLDTIEKAMDSAIKEPLEAPRLVSECISGIVNMDDFLSKVCEEYESKPLQKVVDCLEQIYIKPERSIKQAIRALQDCKKYVRSLPVRYKVVFMPYIASMWPALESVWRAADSDPRCDTYVVPIPYWHLKIDRQGHASPTDLVYEGGKYPHYVPIVNYQAFHIDEEIPDIVYIHNPYDNCNSLTRIPEEYYSENLKKYVSVLVYSPYNIEYSANANQIKQMFPVYRNMDFILLQSQKLADVYVRSGVKPEKILLLGSPKADHIVSPIISPEIPEKWRQKSYGKKVILYNTHMSTVMTQIETSDGNSIPYGVLYVKNVIEEILCNRECALIWRPHPLLQQMLNSRGMKWHGKQIEMLMEKVSSSENGILDLGGDYLPAFILSDALITSGGSSLLSEYLLTGKTVTEANFDRDAQWVTDCVEASPFDLRLIYYASDFMSREQVDECDRLSFSNDAKDAYDLLRLTREKIIRGFVAMVCRGEDPMREQRIRGVQEAFINMDGSCGTKVNRKIIEYMDHLSE